MKRTINIDYNNQNLQLDKHICVPNSLNVVHVVEDDVDHKH